MINADEQRPAWGLAMRRGAAGRCPACGKGRIFARFLKVDRACSRCGTELHHHRADDLPPYVTIFIVGHVVGYGIFLSEMRYEAPLWFHLAVWPALTVIMALLLMQPHRSRAYLARIGARRQRP